MADAVGLIALALGAAALARLLPIAVLPLIVVLVPLRLPLLTTAELSTVVLVGAALGRAPELLRAARSFPAGFAAWAALPLWMLSSSTWAHQPWFAVAEAGKWTAVALAALLAFADDALRPVQVAAMAFAAVAPMALWGLGERLHLVTPIGDPEELQARLIDIGGEIRGRALFWHPNRLAEFLEQLGLLLAACAASGTATWLGAIGTALAIAGTWATGSTAGMAAMVGGAVLTAAAIATWRRGAARPSADPAVARRRWRWLWLLPPAAIAVAIAVAQSAFRAHGGIGSREQVWRYAVKLIAERPWLGLGGGNWPLAVSGAPLSLSRYWFRSHTHSLLLQIWVETGIVGVVAGGAFFVVPLWTAARGLRRCAAEWRGVIAGAMAGVLGLLAHDLVHFFLRQPADGIVTGVLLGIAASARRRSAPGDASRGEPGGGAGR